MKISTHTLKLATSKLLDHLESQGITEIELEKDYYWNLSGLSLYDIDNDPLDFGIGQLYDDYEYLNGLALGEKEPFNFGLTWLASIFRYIGETQKL